MIEGILGNNFHHLLATLKLRGDSVGYNCVKHGCVLKKMIIIFLKYNCSSNDSDARALIGRGLL